MLVCDDYLTPGSLDEAFDMGVQPWTLSHQLRAALKTAHGYDGLSVIYLPVYCGPDELGGLGAWGDWNVGNWCED